MLSSNTQITHAHLFLSVTLSLSLSLTRISFAMSFSALVLSSSTGYNSRCMSSRLASSAPSLPPSRFAAWHGPCVLLVFVSYVWHWCPNRTSSNPSSISHTFGRPSVSDTHELRSQLFRRLQLHTSSQSRVNLAPLSKSLFVHTTTNSYTLRHTSRHRGSSQESTNMNIFESTFSFSILTHKQTESKQGNKLIEVSPTPSFFSSFSLVSFFHAGSR